LCLCGGGGNPIFLEHHHHQLQRCSRYIATLFKIQYMALILWCVSLLRWAYLLLLPISDICSVLLYCFNQYTVWYTVTTTNGPRDRITLDDMQCRGLGRPIFLCSVLLHRSWCAHAWQ
jgi:hypothetical protein